MRNHDVVFGMNTILFMSFLNDVKQQLRLTIVFTITDSFDECVYFVLLITRSVKSASEQLLNGPSGQTVVTQCLTDPQLSKNYSISPSASSSLLTMDHKNPAYPKADQWHSHTAPLQLHLHPLFWDMRQASLSVRPKSTASVWRSKRFPACYGLEI